jgi:cystathionine beta-lyase/cystathionine gamma-synthase
VNYPGLESHERHDRAKRLFGGGYGGMLSFELAGGAPAAKKFIAATTLPLKAPSLGGPETLLTQPSLTSHAGMDPQARRALGISDGLIRMSTGLEATDDIIQDFAAAFGK